MSRKALIVGIDYYSHADDLFGCVNDAYAVNSAIERNADGTVNFGTKILAGTGESNPVTRRDVRTAAQELFAGDSDIALFTLQATATLNKSADT